MKFTEWLKQEKGIPILQLRKRHLNNREWECLCDEYELFCKVRNFRPIYD